MQKILKCLGLKHALITGDNFAELLGVDFQYESIEAGIPQGPYLGPLLFLLYSSELPQALKRVFRFYVR